MISSAGLLDFFILEASDYVERLDGLVAAAGNAGPEADAFARHARALRGSATMAKLGGMAELAGAVERVGRGLRDGTVAWSPALSGAVVAAVDDLKTLIRAVRTWGAAEDRRVQARVAELTGLTGGVRTPAAVPAAARAGAGWLAAEAAAIAASLESVAADAPASGGARPALADALRRVRAMRGVAAVKDHPALGQVLEGVERAARPFELGGGSGAREALDVLSAAVDALRRLAREVGEGSAASSNAPELVRFTLAADALAAATEDADRVVPVDALFHADDGPHVVARAAAPPTTPSERFRLEVVSQAEHLKALVAEGRAADEAGHRDRVGRALRSALRALQRLAESFGERPVAEFVAAAGDGAARLDALALGALDEVAGLLADPATRGDALARRVAELARGRGVDAQVAAAMAGGTDRAPAGVRMTEPRLSHAIGAQRPSAEALPSIDEFVYRDGAAVEPPDDSIEEPMPAPARYPTPTGRELHALLEDSIVGIARLEHQPLSEPVPVVDDSLVDVDGLLYTGRAALARARDLLQSLRDGDTPSPETVDELLDLLELAATR